MRSKKDLYSSHDPNCINSCTGKTPTGVVVNDPANRDMVQQELLHPRPIPDIQPTVGADKDMCPFFI